MRNLRRRKLKVTEMLIWTWTVLKSQMALSLLRLMLSWHNDLTIADTHGLPRMLHALIRFRYDKKEVSIVVGKVEHDNTRNRFTNCLPFVSLVPIMHYICSSDHDSRFPYESSLLVCCCPP